VKHNELPFDDAGSKTPKKPRQPKPKAVPKTWTPKPAPKIKSGKLADPEDQEAAPKTGASHLEGPKYEFKVKEYEAVDPPKVQVVVKVMLEPELEPLIAELKPFERIRLAMKFRRWARQLEVSAKMILNQSHPRRRPKLPRVNWTKAAWN